jgi:DnaJ-like protein
MFERGKGEREGPVEVELALSDGQRLNGKLVLPPGRTLPEVLNGASTFVEFHGHDAGRSFIAKTALHSVTPTSVPPAPDLWAGPTQGAGFDPCAILGIRPTSTREEVRDAYLSLAKLYHPDRYATADLPKEVREYLEIMVRRINAAHDTLQARLQKRESRQEPVFTKAGHGT